MPSQPTIYAAPEHQPFTLTPETPPTGNRVAALLLHGFMGTPAELRPLGEALAEHGVTVHAPLLPGMCPDMAHLDQTTAADWQRAVTDAWRTARAGADQTILLGFSFEAALALSLSAADPPDRLVLLAPYVRLIDLPSWTIALGMPVLKRTVKTFSPFARSNFADPEVRRVFHEMGPTLDVDDPAVQKTLRERATIPMSVVDQLRRATDAGRNAAHHVDTTTLIIQGMRDQTSTASRTRTLAGSLHGPLTLREIDAEHLLVEARQPWFPTVRDEVLHFLAPLIGESAETAQDQQYAAR